MTRSRGRLRLLLRMLAIGDTPRDAAVTREAPALVKHGQSRDGHVALAAIAARHRELEIAERQVGVERLPVPAQGLRVRLQVGQCPGRLANHE